MAAQINICPRLESQVMWLYKWNAYKGMLELLKKKNKCHCWSTYTTKTKSQHGFDHICSTIICRIWMAVKFSVSNKSRHKGRNIYIRFPAKFLFYLGVMQIRNTHPYIKPIEDRYLASIPKQSLPFSLKISLF